VAVRNVGDLMLYLSIIEPLCLAFQHYRGNCCAGTFGWSARLKPLFFTPADHELAISELLQITSNRLTEWRRVWNLARKKGAFRDNMSFVYQHLETSISDFVTMLNAMESI